MLTVDEPQMNDMNEVDMKLLKHDSIISSKACQNRDYIIMIYISCDNYLLFLIIIITCVF